jgi:hypothetical protein
METRWISLWVLSSKIFQQSTYRQSAKQQWCKCKVRKYRIGEFRNSRKAVRGQTERVLTTLIWRAQICLKLSRKLINCVTSTYQTKGNNTYNGNFNHNMKQFTIFVTEIHFILAAKTKPVMCVALRQTINCHCFKLRVEISRKVLVK